MALHDFIEANKDELVRAWIAAVRVRAPEERRFSEAQLLDSMMLFLPEVVVAVRDTDERADRQSFIAQAHGGQRHVLGANVGEVVTEYGILYTLIVERAPEPTREEVSRLARFLFNAAADAARIFTAEHDAALRKNAWEHFAFMAHEIRNPLQSARLAAEVMRHKPQPSALDALERSLHGLSTTVDQALLEARLTGLSAGAELHMERIELLTLARELAEELRGDAEGKRIRIAVDGTPIKVDADQRLMRSALGNLIRNAIKFSRDGAEVRVVTRIDERLGQLVVYDECGGLPPRKAETLFAAFVQSGKDRSGFGLGLAIARQAIEAHKGTIRVDDQPGKGCIFTLELPI